MSKSIKIRKGANIRLEGLAKLEKGADYSASYYAIKPTDFPGLVPKLSLKEGAALKAGTPIFFDKNNPAVKFSSPVSGTLEKIVRGAKRKIMELVVKSDNAGTSESLPSVNLESSSKEDIMKVMLDFGMWPLLRQRPFDIIADPALKPKSIFITGFDSSPLAPDPEFVMQGKEKDFESGLKALKILADGQPIHINASSGKSFFNKYGSLATINTVSGPHPAGNVGVQIHQIDPINAGEVVWTINPQDVAILGHILGTGEYKMERTIAITGSRIKSPSYINIGVGAKLSRLLEDQVTEDNTRIISGNVLTGDAIHKDSYFGFYHHQITAIPEGNEPLFLLTKGWLGPGLDKFSMSRTFPTWLLKGKKFNLNTNLNGEERGYVMSGQYEKVFPFDIYPVHLIKAIMANDIEAMEQLGIYEVAPEDFALCEYACTSKVEAQKIVREGLLNLKEEL